MKRVLKIRKADTLRREVFGKGVSREVFFSPEAGESTYQKMAIVDIVPGSVGLAHVHLGEEIVYTIRGKAVLECDGKEYLLEEGSCCLIPPDTEHPARVIGNENWVAVAAYCDECPVLKKWRNKEGIHYPIISSEAAARESKE